MSNSQCPASGYTISLDSLRELCPDTVASLEAALKAENFSLGEFAERDSEGEFVPRGVSEAFDVLCDDFNEVTRVEDSHGVSNLDLELSYYNEELGDGGDDVEHTDGAIFLVEGVVVRTPAGEKFSSAVQLNRWSVFG